MSPGPGIGAGGSVPESPRGRVGIVQARRRRRSTVAVFTIALGLFGVLAAQNVAAAPDQEELKQRVAAAEAEAKTLRQGMANARRHMFDAEAAAEQAAGELEEIERRLTDGARRSAELAARVERAGKKLAYERIRLRRARAILADRLVAIYMAGSAGAGEVVIGAEGFDQLLVGKEYFAAIEDADGRLAARVEQVRDSVATEAENLSRNLSAAERHEAALVTARDQIGAVTAAAESRAAGLRAAVAERDGVLAELSSKMQAWTEQVEAAERREERRQQQAQSAPAESGSSTVERWLGGPYSIPTTIVMCESGGNYSALNPTSGAGGAYQIMPSTWEAYGGTGLPHLAPKAEQDRIASLIWADSGPSAWVCKA